MPFYENESVAKEQRKLTAKAKRDAARAEIADRSGDITEDDDAMDIDQWRSEDSSILTEFKGPAHTVSDQTELWRARSKPDSVLLSRVADLIQPSP
jgi:hypothetical protein